MIKPLDKSKRDQLHMVYLSHVMPKNHLLSLIDPFVDDEKAFTLLSPFYPKRGRYALHPTIVFRSLLILYIYEYDRIEDFLGELSVNLAYKWFLQLSLDETITQRQLQYHFSRLKESELPQLLEETIVTLEDRSILTPKIHLSARMEIFLNKSED